MRQILFFLELILYRFLAILAVTILKILKPLLPSKLKRMVKDRKTLRLPLLADRPIWIHAASGEIEYAKPVVRALQEKFPHIPIALSYFSPSAEKLLPSESESLKTFPLPWDTRLRVERTLETLKPRAVLFARTDAWPELVYQCSQQEIPTLLFSATLAENSAKFQKFVRPLMIGTFERLTKIHVVSQDDVHQFSRLGVRAATRDTNLEIAGDTRFDQVLHRKSNPRFTTPRPAHFTGKVFIAGSTWSEDEAVIIPALRKFVTAGNHIVIAPHEIQTHRLERVKSLLLNAGISVCLLSETEKINQSQAVIVDTVGILADIYSWGDVAFVGGSFRSKVHSVMEPLAAGLPVAVGPFHINNREALTFQNIPLKNSSLNMVTRVEGEVDFYEWLTRASASSTARTEILEKVQSLSGASKRVVEFIEHNI